MTIRNYYTCLVLIVTLISIDCSTIPPNKHQHAQLPTPEIIKEAGYPIEKHTVTTEDGYVLTLHRIPGNKSGKVVFLQHGFLCSSSDWVLLGKGKALGFLLADRGHDIWLGNSRGNTYSRQHKSLSSRDDKFWDFSFHEMGIYDLPAEINYILNKTQAKTITYIGFSMGSTMFYVMASLLSDMKSKIEKNINLAPIAYFGDVKTPMKILLPFAENIASILHLQGNGHLFHRSWLLESLLKLVCGKNMIMSKLCAFSLFLFTGFDHSHFDYSLLPAIINHVPAGISVKTFLHYTQIATSRKFQFYDYGEQNFARYGQPDPPQYNLSSIDVPTALFYSDNDWLASTKNVEKTAHELPKLIGLYKVDHTDFNHVGYTYAVDANELIYSDVINILEQ